jgi:nucleoside-diphosphate-sugar epimerase
LPNRTAKKGHILITGGTGFIGSYLSNGLVNAGYKVTTVSRSLGINGSHICADFTDRKSLTDLANQLCKVDTIIHCAAIAHGQKPPKNLSTSDYNTLISKNILNAFDKAKIRWIFLSSISVYGDMHSESAIPLILSPNPIDSYGLGKLRDEKLFISNCNNLDILRIMPVYNSQNLQDIRKRVFLPKINKKIHIQPEPYYSICEVEEVLNAVKRCMIYKSGQRLTQVGDLQQISQKDLGKWFPGKPIPVPQILFRAAVSLLTKKISVLRNISFMLKKLGLNNIYEIGCIELVQVKSDSRDTKLP